jgi:hypothetical protein
MALTYYFLSFLFVVDSIGFTDNGGSRSTWKESWRFLEKKRRMAMNGLHASPTESDGNQDKSERNLLSGYLTSLKLNPEEFEKFFENYLNEKSSLISEIISDPHGCAHKSMEITPGKALEIFKTKEGKFFVFSKNLPILGKGVQKTVWIGRDMNSENQVAVSCTEEESRFPIYEKIEHLRPKNLVNIRGICEIKELCPKTHFGRKKPGDKGSNLALWAFSDRMQCGFSPEGSPNCQTEVNDLQILEILVGALQGMKELYKIGWHHGDFHIGNIMYNLVGDKPEVALIDFDQAVRLYSPEELENLKKKPGWRLHEQNSLSKELRLLWEGIFSDPAEIENFGKESPEFMLFNLHKRAEEELRPEASPLTIDDWIIEFEKIIQKMNSLKMKDFR